MEEREEIAIKFITIVLLFLILLVSFLIYLNQTKSYTYLIAGFYDSQTNDALKQKAIEKCEIANFRRAVDEDSKAINEFIFKCPK